MVSHVFKRSPLLVTISSSAAGRRADLGSHFRPSIVVSALQTSKPSSK